MTADEIQAALDRGAWTAPPPSPNPARPVAECIGCSDRDALAMAQAERLIDADGMLHCWKCNTVCTWHVSLHCTGCRLETIRSAPDRRRDEYRAEVARRQQEPSRPVQKVGNRSFRDGY